MYLAATNVIQFLLNKIQKLKQMWKILEYIQLNYRLQFFLNFILGILTSKTQPGYGIAQQTVCHIQLSKHNIISRTTSDTASYSTSYKRT